MKNNNKNNNRGEQRRTGGEIIITDCFYNFEVACEICTKTGMIMVMGEITSNAVVPYEDIIRDVFSPKNTGGEMKGARKDGVVRL